MRKNKSNLKTQIKQLNETLKDYQSNLEHLRKMDAIHREVITSLNAKITALEADKRWLQQMLSPLAQALSAAR